MKNLTIFFKFFLSIFFLANIIYSQENNILEKLGFDKDSKLLIIHNDDIGMSQSVNSASFDAFNEGHINSGSVMVLALGFSRWLNIQKKIQILI